MLIYHTLGKIPAKRHIVFRQPDGTLYPEQLAGMAGFLAHVSWEPVSAQVMTTFLDMSASQQTKNNRSARNRLCLKDGEAGLGGAFNRRLGTGYNNLPRTIQVCGNNLLIPC